MILPTWFAAWAGYSLFFELSIIFIFIWKVKKWPSLLKKTYTDYTVFVLRTLGRRFNRGFDMKRIGNVVTNNAKEQI